jgi:hypothetical protein
MAYLSQMMLGLVIPSYSTMMLGQTNNALLETIG